MHRERTRYRSRMYSRTSRSFYQRSSTQDNCGSGAHLQILSASPTIHRSIVMRWRSNETDWPSISINPVDGTTVHDTQQPPKRCPTAKAEEYVC